MKWEGIRDGDSMKIEVIHPQRRSTPEKSQGKDLDVYFYPLEHVSSSPQIVMLRSSLCLWMCSPLLTIFPRILIKVNSF